MKNKITPRATLSTSPNVTRIAPDIEVDYAALFEGFEDWERYSDTTSSIAVTSPRKKSVPLCRQFIQCRIQSIESDTFWNPISKRMERKLTIIIDSKNPPVIKRILLCDEWTEIPLAVDNTLNLVSLPSSIPLNLESEILVFSRAEPSHLIILFPSILISATIVSGAPSCSRKSILSHRLNSSSNFMGEAVVRGNIVHDIIQNILVSNTNEVDESFDSTQASIETWKMPRLMKEARKACIRRISDLFMIGMSLDQGVAMVSDHLKELPSWSNKYIISPNSEGEIILNKDAVLTDPRSKAKSPDALPKIAITGVVDIEEEIWSPKYGLKGKIDGTVQAAIIEDSSLLNTLEFDEPMRGNTHLFPLEIKTGKKPSGMEHISQTMLYTLLMSDRYNIEVTAGLLLYTSSNELTRVRAVKEELRQLIITRNRLASFLHHSPDNVVKPQENSGLTDVEDLVLSPAVPGIFLPEAIDEESSCARCFSLESCMLYRKAVEGNDTIIGVSDTLSNLYIQKTGHLTPTHTEFFRRWDGLISLEERELGKFKKDIWEKSAEEREKKGQAFSNMVVDCSFDIQKWLGNVKSSNKIHRYTYCFVRAPTLKTIDFGSPPSLPKDSPSSTLLFGQIHNSDPIVISIEGEKLAIARGFVCELTPRYVIVGLDHRIENAHVTPFGSSSETVWTPKFSSQPSQPQTRYRIDKDELIAGMGRIRDNLVQLFLEKGNSKLRELVVDLRKPEFGKLDDDAHVLGDMGSLNLNENQKEVISKVMCAKDYALVLGMPGTGKTTTIAELIKALTKAEKTVLLTSYTHSAVDNTLSKLISSNIRMLRLGNIDKVAPSLRPYTLDESKPPQTVEELEQKLIEPRLVAATSLSINHPLFFKRKFDYCIVDEASQITLPTCLGPLRYADKFVLVGDHFQLPPLVKNEKARIGGLEVSMFKLLTESHPESVVSLSIQYRMNQDIMSLSNALIYDGRLRCANENVSNLSLDIPLGLDLDFIHSQDSVSCSKNCWIAAVSDPQRKVLFMDTDRLKARESLSGKLLQNDIEADLVFQIVGALLHGGVLPSDIAVITPYRQQIKLLLNMFIDTPELEILTADKSQGRDKDCIIMTMVRNNADEQVGNLLKDWRRINVCLTRAKKKLVIFGSKQTLKQSRVLNDFFVFIERKGWIFELEKGSENLHVSLSSATSLLVNPSNSPSGQSILQNCTNSIIKGKSKRGVDCLQSPSKLSKPKKLSLGLSKSLEPLNIIRDVTAEYLEQKPCQ